MTVQPNATADATTCIDWGALSRELASIECAPDLSDHDRRREHARVDELLAAADLDDLESFYPDDEAAEPTPAPAPIASAPAPAPIASAAGEPGPAPSPFWSWLSRHSVKKVKSSRFRSRAADAEVIKRYQTLRASGAAAATAGTSVIYVKGDHSSDPSLSSSEARSAGELASEASLTPTPSSTRKRAPMASWWERPLNPHPRDHLRTRPPEWRELTDPAVLFWCHTYLASLGPVQGFSLRLNHAIEAQAKSKPNAVEFLRRRVARELKAAFGRPVSFIVALEQDERGALHVHGELSLPEVDAPKARKALRRAGGEWSREKGRQHQCQTEPDPDAGWASYLAKDVRFASPFFRALGRGPHGPRLQFQGGVLSATSDVKAGARNLYNSFREEISADFRASRAVPAADASPTEATLPGSTLNTDLPTEQSEENTCESLDSSSILPVRTTHFMGEPSCIREPSPSRPSLTSSTNSLRFTVASVGRAWSGRRRVFTRSSGRFCSSKIMTRKAFCSSARAPPRITCPHASRDSIRGPPAGLRLLPARVIAETAEAPQ